MPTKDEGLNSVTTSTPLHNVDMYITLCNDCYMSIWPSHVITGLQGCARTQPPPLPGPHCLEWAWPLQVALQGEAGGEWGRRGSHMLPPDL